MLCYLNFFKLALYFQTKANKNYLMSNIDHYARKKKLAPMMSWKDAYDL